MYHALESRSVQPIWELLAHVDQLFGKVGGVGGSGRVTKDAGKILDYFASVQQAEVEADYWKGVFEEVRIHHLESRYSAPPSRRRRYLHPYEWKNLAARAQHKRRHSHWSEVNMSGRQRLRRWNTRLRKNQHACSMVCGRFSQSRALQGVKRHFSTNVVGLHESQKRSCIEHALRV